MIKHVSYVTFSRISIAARELAACERGCRQQKRKAAEIKTAYLNKFAHEAKALPKKGQIRVIYKRTKNLADSKICGDYYTDVTYDIADSSHIKFTDKTVIIYHSYNSSKTVIKHKNVIAFVWGGEER